MSQKFHGITLANNSTAKNFHFERLAADPVVMEPGRIWVNTTEKLFKYSTLDSNGIIVISSFADATSLISSITSLQASITSETNARIAADNVVASNASDLIATETTARLAGDAAQVATSTTIQTELDTTQASVGLNVDGTYSSPLSTTYLGTASSIKGSTVLLDSAIAAEVLARTNKDTVQDAALTAEAQSRIDGDANLQAQLTAYIDAAVTNNTNADNAETVRAIAAESAIKAELDLTQASVGTAADGSLVPYTGTNYLNTSSTIVAATVALDTQVFSANQAVAAESVARAAANVSFNASLQTEITDRTNAVSVLQSEINNIEAGAGLEATGLYSSPTGSNYLNAAVNLKDADFILDSAIKVIDNKVVTIQTQVTNEVARSVTNDATTATALSTLSSNIANETVRAINAETALQTAIDNLVMSSGDGSVALKTTLNSGRFTYIAPTADLIHVIQHNFNTSFYLADVKVEGDDLIYRNDICPIEEIDSNSFRITLSESRKVKVGVLSLAPIV